MSDVELKIVTMPMLDTGIGREAGFRDDAHLREAAKAEREAMDPAAREMADSLDEKMERALLFGES